MEGMELEPEAIKAIWQALQRPAPKATYLPTGMEGRMVGTGWVSDTEVEDFLLIQDRRLDPLEVVNPATLAAKLGIPHRTIFPRPERRNDDMYGRDQISVTDTAALCIWLERLGFRIDVSSLCNRLRPDLEGRAHLTDEEISVLFYEGNRHRLPSVSLTAPHRAWRGMRTCKFKTEGGYSVEYTEDDEGLALWLTVRSPKFRKPPETLAVVCPECEMTYVKGSRTDEREHRKSHRRWSAVVDPKPHRQFAAALERDLDASWVDAEAPTWKRKAVYEGARLFRREFGYDFVQWSVEDDPDAVGFLFSDEEGRITGACAFRQQQANDARPWKLDWIWLCPGARRLGLLSRQWDRFRQRFGVFDIETPISDAMKAFLLQRGCRELIR